MDQPLRAIDFHVHLPTPDWLDDSMDGYVEAAEAYFRSPVERLSLADLAVRYQALDVKAVLLAWDAETATGRPRVPNETVAAACARTRTISPAWARSIRTRARPRWPRWPTSPRWGCAG